MCYTQSRGNQVKSNKQGEPFVEDKFLCTTDWPPNVGEGAFPSLATGAVSAITAVAVTELTKGIKKDVERTEKERRSTYDNLYHKH